MISKYDLYDITYALILIRNDIYQSTNTAVLSQIIKALNGKDNDGENQIRMAISTVEGLNHDQWSFVYHNNFYVNHPLVYIRQVTSNFRKVKHHKNYTVILIV